MHRHSHKPNMHIHHRDLRQSLQEAIKKRIILDIMPQKHFTQSQGASDKCQESCLLKSDQKIGLALHTIKYIDR